MMDSSKEGIPRRLELDDEIIQYLQTLDGQITKNGIEESDKESIEILVNNVLSEIKNRCGSLASDRKTSLIIEKLVLLSDIPQIIEFCRKLSPYSLFLAKNRYSSHVLQSLFSRICHLIQTNGSMEEHADNLEEVVLSLLNPLLMEISWLARDVSASHVLRSALSLLAGLPVISERKGKSSKHQHSVSYSVTLDTLLTPGQLTIDRRHFFDVPAGYLDAVERTIEILSEAESSTLHELLADASSCAVITLLYRFASASYSLTRGKKLAESFLRKVLEWSVDSEKVNTELFYAMAGDKCASHFLEMAIEVTSLDVILSVLEASLVNRIGEYAKDGAANFVVQAAMRRLCLELEQTNMKDDEFIRVMTLSIAFIEEIIDPILLSDLLAYKGGVVLWMITLAKPLIDTCESTVKKVNKQIRGKSVGLRQRIGQAIVDHWTSVRKSSSESLSEFIYRKLTTTTISTGDDTSNNEVNTTASTTETESNLKPKSKSATSGPADSTQLMLARQLGAMLRLKVTSNSNDTSSTEAFESKSLETIVSLIGSMPSDVILHVATSGQLSRGLLDPFIELHSQSSHFGKFMKSFVTIAGTLAGHYVGQHLFRKAFRSAGYKDKERMVQQLIVDKESLNRTKEGRASLQLVNAEGYTHDADDWLRGIKRQARVQDMLAEIEGTTAPTNINNKSTNTSGSGSGIQKSKSLQSSYKNTIEVSNSTQSQPSKSLLSTTESSSKVNKHTNYNENDGSDDDMDNDNDDGDADAHNQARKRKRKRPQKGVKKLTSFSVEESDEVDQVIDDSPVVETDKTQSSEYGNQSQSEYKPAAIQISQQRSRSYRVESNIVTHHMISSRQVLKQEQRQQQSDGHQYQQRQLSPDHHHHHHHHHHYQHDSSNQNKAHASQNYSSRRSDENRTKQIKELWHLNSRQILQAAEQLVVQDKKQKK